MTDSDNSLQQPPVAGLLRRMAALLYDGFLVAAIWMLIGYSMQIISGGNSNQLVDGVVQTDPLIDNILFLLMLASSGGFYIWFWTRSGQTLGMIAWKIKVVANDGGLLSVQQGIVRFLLAWPSFFMFGLGYLWLYLDPNGDALHDKLSRSRVIVMPKSHKPFS